MRRFYIFLFIAAVLFSFAYTADAQSEAGEWGISLFRSDIDIEEDGTVHVTETIRADFAVDKHGIFRDIPVVYENEDGSELYTEVKVTGVRRNEAPETYSTFHDNGWLRIKIGDPNRTIRGSHQYIIEYEVAGVLRSFGDFDELAWNVTGFWPVPIARVVATVEVPGNKAEILQSACYVGEYGDRAECESSRVFSNKMQFTSPWALQEQQNMTVSAGYTPGVIPIVEVEGPPGFTEQIGMVFDVGLALKVFAVSLPLFVLVILFLVWHRGRDWVFHKKEGDEKIYRKRFPLFGYEAISPEYEVPEELRPAEVGLLQDETADTLDISATIVDLARRGYLNIKEEQKFKFLGIEVNDYELSLIKDKDGSLRKYERMLLDALFESSTSVKISDLRNTFYKDLKKIKDELYEEGMRKNFFEKHPAKVRIKYFIIGAAIESAGIFSVVYGIAKGSGFLVGIGAAGAVAGIVAMVVARFMSRRSARGRELWRKVRGYKLFIEQAEAHRARFYEEKGLFFEVLPYAIVFRVAQKLADKFEQMGMRPPEPGWYTGAHPFGLGSFTSDVRGFSTSVSRTMASSPSSSSSSGGGGFSGGGFGGGGGGSW